MRIFYGWIVLAALLIAYTATNGITVNTLPMLFPVLGEEFGINQQQITSAPALLFLLTAVLSTLFGILVEKFDVRNLTITGSLLFVGAYLLLSGMTAYWQFLLVYVLFAVCMILTGIMPSVLLITRWFQKYRGIAIGVLLMGSSLGAAIFPPIVGPIMHSSGWRTAALVLTGIIAICVLIPMLVVVRNYPSDKGTVPDGLYPSSSEYDATGADARTNSATMHTGYNMQEVLSMPVFYLLAFVTAVMWFCIVGVTQNQTLFFKDLAMEASFSTKVLFVFGVCAMIGKLLFGALSDRFDKRSIMLLATLNLTLGSSILRLMENNPAQLAMVYAVIYGIGFSGAFTMIQVMIAEYFGGLSYPKVLGVFTMIDTLAGSAGAFVLGAMRTAMGSYIPAFTMMIVLCCLAVVCVIILRKPEPKQA
ncbi:MAG: MFS transporter [Bacteroidota bacterium]|nr:MFS transporter [Candidatus Kapabacteria bacterium]MDW8219202.1 MFS transporter [Bacteroidota bacterium]